MHAIIRHYATIPPDALPTMRDFMTGVERPATAHELAQMDIFCVNEAAHLYAVGEQFHQLVVDFGDKLEGVWYHHTEAPPKTPEAKMAAPTSAIDAMQARAEQLGRTVHSWGDKRERHNRLPDTVKPRILRSQVITGRATIDSSLIEQQTAIDENVGPIMTSDLTNPARSLVDLTTPAALIAEAERLAAIETVTDVQQALVPMADVDADEHVVVRDGLIPMAWAGEV